MKTVPDFRDFCTRHSLEKKIDVESLISEAEQKYLEVEVEEGALDSEKDKASLHRLLSETLKLPDDEIKEIEEKRAQKEPKKGIQ